MSTPYNRRCDGWKRLRPTRASSQRPKIDAVMDSWPSCRRVDRRGSRSCNPDGHKTVRKQRPHCVFACRNPAFPEVRCPPDRQEPRKSEVGPIPALGIKHQNLASTSVAPSAAHGYSPSPECPVAALFVAGQGEFEDAFPTVISVDQIAAHEVGQLARYGKSQPE